MVDAPDLPRRRSSVKLRAITPQDEARAALMEARKLIDFLEDNTHPSIGKLREVNEAQRQLRKRLAVIHTALKDPA